MKNLNANNLGFLVFWNIILLSHQIGVIVPKVNPMIDASCSLRSSYNATTVGIKEIFIGRCYYFLNVLQKTNCEIDPRNYDCLAIWNEFEKVIIGKEPCSIKIEDFDKFLELVNHPIPESKTLFWSGTYSTAYQRIINIP